MTSVRHKASIDDFILASKYLEKTALEYVHTENDLYRAAFCRWLQTRNVINMQRICQSFYDNRLHYPQSLNSHSLINQVPEDSFDTSLNALENTFEQIKPREALPIISSYRIKKGYNAAKVLKSLLFSYTTVECMGSTNIMFYLTIYDVIKLIYNDKADKIFNELFGSHRSLEERFSFGLFVSYLTDKSYESLCPHQYFTEMVSDISLTKLVNFPEYYIGMKFYVKGHENYLHKHPQGAAQGWNVIFYGLDSKKNPLFLAAMEPGKSFCLTYQELIQVLKNEYNILPSDISLKSYLKEPLINEDKIIGLQDYCAWFNLKKIVMLKDAEKVSIQLKEFAAVEKANKLPQLESCDIIDHSKLKLHPTSIITKKINPFKYSDTETPTKHSVKTNRITDNPYFLNAHKRKKPNLELKKSCFKPYKRSKSSS